MNLIRGLVLLRDRGKCQYDDNGKKCLSTFAVDVHHITPKSKGGTDDVNNFISLCKTHHGKMHRSTKKELLIHRIIEDNYVSISFIASFVGVTQPAMSLLLRDGIKGLDRALQIKDALNYILDTSYALEELFSPEDDDALFLTNHRIEQFNNKLNEPIGRSFNKSELQKISKSIDTFNTNHKDKGGVHKLIELRSEKLTLLEIAEYFGVSNERVRQIINGYEILKQREDLGRYSSQGTLEMS